MACDPQLLLRLEEARKAYHDLNTGRMARVVVDQNGERVEFVAANRAALYLYLSGLETQVAACSANGLSCPTPSGPAGFIF